MTSDVSEGTTIVRIGHVRLNQQATIPNAPVWVPPLSSGTLLPALLSSVLRPVEISPVRVPSTGGK